MSRYDIRDHMARGVVAVWWCEPGRADSLEATMGEQRLPLLATVLAGRTIDPATAGYLIRDGALWWHEPGRIRDHREMDLPDERRPLLAIAVTQRTQQEAS